MLSPRLVLLSSLSALAVSCASVGSKPAGPPKIQMDPIRIQAEVDPLVGLDTYDAGDLLARGNALYEKRDFDKALILYDKLVAEFPESSLASTALYNAGLSLQKLEEHAEAAKRYEQIIERHPGSTSAKDAHFRGALCYSKLERWPDVEKLFWAVRQRDGLNPMDEIEARVGMAIALFMQEEYATAEREFLRALRFYDEHAQKEFLPAKYWIAQSRFYIGEIAAREFESIVLDSQTTDHEAWKAELTRKLERKCELLLRAQNNFIRTIRAGHTGWATASGYRIGSLYEKLYDDLVDVPVPPGLEQSAHEYYLGEVKLRVAVLVKKAIKVYERSLDMANRVGEANEWVERTEKALERMKELALKSMES